VECRANAKPKGGDLTMLAGLVDKASVIFADLRRDLRGVTREEYCIVFGAAAIVIVTTAIGVSTADVPAVLRQVAAAFVEIF
jgi:Flp pilus assembly pilin Flp